MTDMNSKPVSLDTINFVLVKLFGMKYIYVLNEISSQSFFSLISHSSPFLLSITTS